MSIDFTDREYRLLVHMLLLAEWVLFADNNDDPGLDEYRDLLHKLIAKADQHGLRGTFEYNREHARYVPSADFEENEGYMNLLDRFIDNSFWEELLARITERDLMRQLGEEAYQNLAPEQRSEMLKGLEEYYYQEFRNHGIDNFQLRQDEAPHTLH